VNEEALAHWGLLRQKQTNIQQQQQQSDDDEEDHEKNKDKRCNKKTTLAYTLPYSPVDESILTG